MMRLLLLGALVPNFALAQDHVLFVDFGGSYSAVDGVNMHAEITRLDANATYVNLASTPGAAAAALALDTYEQVWVYDLSTAADAYTADFQAITDWYATSSGEVIADGRFLSSFWNGRYSAEGRVVTENYYTNLMNEGGGLVLATDHNAFSTAGINVLGAQLGFGPFIGNFGGSFPVDTNNPLMTTPNTITSLANDSSTGQAPFGLQPNGVILDAVGYHSGNTATPGISSTIDGTLNLVVTIDAPVDGAVVCAYDTTDAIASATGITGAISYAWESNVDGPLGTGNSIVIDGAAMSLGMHTLRVIGTDTINIDDADISIEIGGATCDDDGDGVINGEDQCPGFDDALDADLDGVPDDCDMCEGDDATGDTDQDGVCDDIDLCEGDDATGDSDGDGLCDDLDLVLDVSEVVVGSTVTFTVRNAPPGSTIYIMGSRVGEGPGACAPGGAFCTGLLSGVILLSDVADASGTYINDTVVVPPSVGQAGNAWFQAFWFDPVNQTGDITEIEHRFTSFP